MALALQKNNIIEQFNILLIGNNPIELSTISEKLAMLKDKRFIAEIAFDVQSVLSKKMKSKPTFILIDDNIGKSQIKQIVTGLAKKRDTENIPITVLKNSNTGTSVEGVQEFVLKHSTDGEALAKALFNSMRLKKTQEFFLKSFSGKRRKLKSVIYGF